MSWYALRVTPGAHREAVIAALFAAGAEGVHEDGDAVVTHFPTEGEAREAAGRLAPLLSGNALVVEPTPPVDWSVAWREHLRDYPLGSLTIVPPWLAEGRDPARTIVIEPGMAFGTGDHPSTRGAGRLLEATVRPGLHVADFGTGSAVLAIAAAKLGASHVFAVENDPDALDNARENIARNAVADVVDVLEGDAGALLPVVGPVDVIVANIVSSVIVSLLPAMAGALRAGGRAVIAGMLTGERSEVHAALDALGWRITNEDVEEGWWSARIEPR